MASLTRRQLARLSLTSPVALFVLAACGQEDVDKAIDNARQTAIAAVAQTAEAELKKRLPELPKVPELPKLPDLPSFGWTFSDLPVTVKTIWRNGFGANGFAQFRWNKYLEDPKKYPFPYAATSGLHTGLDFGYKDYTKKEDVPVVYARVEGKIVGLSRKGDPHGEFPGDALPNIVVKVKGQDHYVLFGHVDKDPNNPDIKIDGEVNAETKLGTLFDQDGNTHLHLCVRIGSRAYNPLDFFKKETIASINWGEFVPKEDAWSMKSFLYNSIDVANFWAKSDNTALGIERR